MTFRHGISFIRPGKGSLNCCTFIKTHRLHAHQEKKKPMQIGDFRCDINRCSAVVCVLMVVVVVCVCSQGRWEIQSMSISLRFAVNLKLVLTTSLKPPEH